MTIVVSHFWGPARFSGKIWFRPVKIQVFHRCDSDHKGYLNKQEIKVAVIALFGYKPSKYEVEKIMENSSSIGVDLQQFIQKMTPKLESVDEDEEIRQTFLVFDSQCRGFLTVEDLKKAFSNIAPNLPVHSIESAFREVDRDGDGRVSYKDFEFMMKYSVKDGF